MKEEWRFVSGYEGKYQVSSFGRVRSVDHYVEQISSYGCQQRRLMRGRILRQNKTRNGYLIVYFSIGKKYQWHTVHRLVAETFLPNKDNLSDVNHKDGNKCNNKLENLEWCSRSYNIKHSYDKLHRAILCKKITCLNDGSVIHGLVRLSKNTSCTLDFIRRHTINRIFCHNDKSYYIGEYETYNK